MSNYEKQITVLTQYQIPAFQKIVNLVTEKLGTESAAAKWFGISQFVLQRLKFDGYLTQKQAKKILTSYKSKKQKL